MTDLLFAEDIHVLTDGFTDHLVNKLEPVALVATTRGSPIFTLDLERVRVDLSVLVLFFLHAIIKAASRQKEKKVVTIVFMIIFFLLTFKQAYALHRLGIFKKTN